MNPITDAGWFFAGLLTGSCGPGGREAAGDRCHS